VRRKARRPAAAQELAAGGGHAGCAARPCALPRPPAGVRWCFASLLAAAPVAALAAARTPAEGFPRRSPGTGAVYCSPAQGTVHVAPRTGPCRGARHVGARREGGSSAASGEQPSSPPSPCTPNSDLVRGTLGVCAMRRRCCTPGVHSSGEAQAAARQAARGAVAGGRPSHLFRPQAARCLGTLAVETPSQAWDWLTLCRLDARGQPQQTTAWVPRKPGDELKSSLAKQAQRAPCSHFACKSSVLSIRRWAYGALKTGHVACEPTTRPQRAGGQMAACKACGCYYSSGGPTHLLAMKR
jgi:hypothetical protein